MIAVRLAVADLTESWTAWLAVSLSFITASGAVSLCGLSLMSVRADPSGTDVDSLFIATAAFNLVVTGCVAAVVIGAAVGLVVSARREALARLALAGAGRGQTVAMLAIQLSVVTIVGSIVGNVVAVAIQPVVLSAIAEDRGYPVPESTVSPIALVVSTLACVGLALLGGLRQCLRASRVDPVESLRQATGAPPPLVSRWRHALGLSVLGLCALSIAVSVAVFLGVADRLGDDAGQTITQIALYSLPIMGLGLGVAAPTLTRPVTRVWTAPFARMGVTWRLARHIVDDRAERLARSVVPVMFTIGLVFGSMLLTETLVRTMELNGGPELEGTSVTSMVSLIGLPLAVAIAGSVGNVVMLSRRRDASLALAGVVGATPTQLRLLAVMEGTIVVGTAAILGLVMAVAPAAVMRVGMRHAFSHTTFGYPVGHLLTTLFLTWVILTLATLLPSLRAINHPSPTVVLGSARAGV